MMAPIRQNNLCCSAVRTWRAREGGNVKTGTSIVRSQAHPLVYLGTLTRLSLTRGLLTAHVGPHRQTGGWTEGEDTLELTGLGKPAERKKETFLIYT